MIYAWIRIIYHTADCIFFQLRLHLALSSVHSIVSRYMYDENTETIFGWLINWLLLIIQRGVFRLYSGWEQAHQYLKMIQYWGRNVTTGATNFDCHWKSMESWEEWTIYNFCSAYNVLTLFRNIQKRSLTCSEHGTLQTLWSAISYPYYSPTNEMLGSSVGRVIRTVTSTQDCVWTYITLWSVSFNIASSASVGTFICVNQGKNQRETTSNGTSFAL